MPVFEENIRLSFAKVKEDIQRLEEKLQNIQTSLENMEKLISSLQQAQPQQSTPSLNKKEDLPQESEVCKGKDGVYSFIHSLFIHSFTSQNTPKTLPCTALSAFQEEINIKFRSLSSQEFLTFLTVYHLEDELGKVTYPLIAKTLNLSEGCIRTYVSSLLKKGLPILKIKPNNKTTLLSISQEFRSLNLKKALSDLYYSRTDIEQKRLDNF